MNVVKPFTSAQLTGSAATYYTSPATSKTVIKQLTFCNTSTNPETVTVYLVPSGGTAGVTNIVWSAKLLAPGETKECFDAHQVLDAGGTIQAFASTTLKVTLSGWGVMVG